MIKRGSPAFTSSLPVSLLDLLRIANASPRDVYVRAGVVEAAFSPPQAFVGCGSCECVWYESRVGARTNNKGGQITGKCYCDFMKVKPFCGTERESHLSHFATNLTKNTRKKHAGGNDGHKCFALKKMLL